MHEQKFDIINQKLKTLEINPWEMWAHSWAEDTQELNYLFRQVLVESRHFLFRNGDNYQITPSGWDYLDSLKSRNPLSNIGFIAMWFEASMNCVLHDALEPAIENAGYKPLRIDKHQHNNKIDDEIVAGIRRSKFVVADFTAQRGGVYFEAGFALGLGLPVIWLCRKDDLKNIHFDNRQYNFILWEPEKLSDLKSALQNRIEATIGKGAIIETNPSK